MILKAWGLADLNFLFGFPFCFSVCNWGACLSHRQMHQDL